MPRGHIVRHFMAEEMLHRSGWKYAKLASGAWLYWEVMRHPWTVKALGSVVAALPDRPGRYRPGTYQGPKGSRWAKTVRGPASSRVLGRPHPGTIPSSKTFVTTPPRIPFAVGGLAWLAAGIILLPFHYGMFDEDPVLM